jgi:hypothetical protein
MFHVVATPFLFVFCLLHSQKCALGDVGKSMIPVFPTPCNVIFCLLDYSFCAFCRPKETLGEVEETIFQGNVWT